MKKIVVMAILFLMLPGCFLFSNFSGVESLKKGSEFLVLAHESLEKDWDALATQMKIVIENPTEEEINKYKELSNEFGKNLLLEGEAIIEEDKAIQILGE